MTRWARLALRAARAPVLALCLSSCTGGEGPAEPSFDPSGLWARWAVENEAGSGTIAYATFLEGAADGEPVELPSDARLTCYGRRMDLTVEAWTGIVHYRVVVPDLGAGGRYPFVLAPAEGAAIEGEVALPSPVEIDAEASDAEAQPGRDLHFALSPGEADELEVSVVATCLTQASASLPGDATSATIPGEEIRCACEGGGLVPPCEGLLRAQRIRRGQVSEAFAGGEALGVQRHEVDVSVVPE